MRMLNIVSWLAVSFLLAPCSRANLIIYDSEADFLAAAPIISTSTFDDFSGYFVHHRIALDGVAYNTTMCTNGCWSLRSHPNSVTPPNIFGSSAIGTNKIAFGPGRWVEALGFWFIAGGRSVPEIAWEIIVNELDGTNTLISVLSEPAAVLNYFGFVSDIGISKITVQDFEGIPGASRWDYDNVSRSAILGGEPLPDCAPASELGVLRGSCVEELSYVSEPTILALMGLGIAGLRLSRNVRRK